MQMLEIGPYKKILARLGENLEHMFFKFSDFLIF